MDKNISFDEAINYANNLVLVLRKLGIYVETDICKRSVKAQFKYADRLTTYSSVI